MRDDPYRTQTKTKKDNQEKILSILHNGAKGFNKLANDVKLSKPILSKHLKSLQEQKLVAKVLINGRIVYALTKGAYNLPFLHTLVFEDAAYSRITGELSRERKDYIGTHTVLFEDREKIEDFVGLEINPQVIVEKSESEIIQAIDKWLAPIVLYAIIQEWKTGHEWTKAVNSVVQKLMELVKMKDLGKFEEVLREKYSKNLVQKYFFILPEERIPLVDSLDGIIEHIKSLEYIDEWERERRRKGTPPFEVFERSP